MARQSKKSRNELDLILEQLKRSYAADSDNSLEDDLLESPKSEEDAELNEILGRIFSYEENQKEPEPIQENTQSIAEATSDSNEQVSEAGATDAESEPEATTEIIEAIAPYEDNVDFPVEETIEELEECNIEPELNASKLLVENFADESLSNVEVETSSHDDADIDAVDNVLNIMFSSKSKNGKAELGGKAVESIIEDTVPDANPEPIIEDIEESEEFDTDAIEQFSLEDIAETPAVDEEDILFAVEDEEYSTDEEIDVAQDDELIDTISAEEPEIQQYEPISLPHIILTRAEYTQDPLQYSFPTLTSHAPTIGTIQDKSAAHEKIVEHIEKTESIHKEEVFDENDISLLLNIGYDHEIRAKVGEKKTQQVMMEADNSFTPDPTKKVFGFCGKELTNRKQIHEIKEKYKTDQKNLIILLSVVSILSLLLLYITFSFEFYADKVTNFPIFLLMDFALVLLIMTVLYKKLVSGISKLMKLETSSNTILFFIATAYALYTIFSLIAYAISGKSVTPKELMLFGFAVSIYAVLTLVSDLLNCIRERRTFNIISSSDTLYTAEKSDIKTVNKSAVASENNYRIRKTKLISGYFRKTTKNDDIGIKPFYLIGIVPIISLALGLAVYFLSSSISLCVSVVMLSLLLCVPVPFVFTSTLIHFILLNPTSDKKSAYIGNSAPEEMSKAKCITVSDNDCVEILGYTEIHPSVRGDTGESLKIAYEIFSALGGPLATIGSSEISHSARTSHDVVINQITNDGIDIYYDSSVNVLLGDKHYMQSHNIKVKTDTNLLTATKGSEKSVIFMAFDGVPKLGFIINSRITSKFMIMSESLIKSGIRICVQSYEPQINNLYFEQNKGQFMSSVNVIKPDNYESSDTRDMCDGCVVSASDSFELAQMIAKSRKVSEHLKINKLVNVGTLVSCILASFMIAVLAIYGTNIIEELSVLTNHLTTVFNILMVASLIPVIVQMVAIFKNKKR